MKQDDEHRGNDRQDSPDDGGQEVKQHATPMLDQLEDGPWPRFVTGLKRLRDSKVTKNVSRRLLGSLNYRTVRSGFFVGDQEGMAYYPMPTTAQLESVHYDWWRSAQAIAR